MMITYLADYPEYLPTVATWVFQEWGHYMPGSSVEQFEGQFGTHLNRDAVPLTLIALADQVMLGTASLVAHDMPIRPNLSPWLASVYVPPEHRQQGIGSRLVQSIEEIARQLHIPRLYLFTPDREHFYARLGWSVVERPEFWNQQVVIMSKFLWQLHQD